MKDGDVIIDDFFAEIEKLVLLLKESKKEKKGGLKNEPIPI